jgi:hypothetical protein
VALDGPAGYDLSFFLGDVPEELICDICEMVVRQAVAIFGDTRFETFKIMFFVCDHQCIKLTSLLP